MRRRRDESRNVPLPSHVTFFLSFLHRRMMRSVTYTDKSSSSEVGTFQIPTRSRSPEVTFEILFFFSFRPRMQLKVQWLSDRIMQICLSKKKPKTCRIQIYMRSQYDRMTQKELKYIIYGIEFCPTTQNRLQIDDAEYYSAQQMNDGLYHNTFKIMNDIYKKVRNWARVVTWLRIQCLWEECMDNILECTCTSYRGKSNSMEPQ